MKTIPVALQPMLTAEVSTLATCWLVVRTDGVTFGFCDHDFDLTVSGVTYKANTGYSPTQIQWTAALNVDNLEVQGYLDSASITDADIYAGLWDYAQISVFYCNWADTTQGIIKGPKGRLGAVKTGKLVFVAELRGLMQNLQQQIGHVVTPLCDATLGDSRCTINLATYTFTGAITGVTSNRVFADTGRTEADDYFDAGLIKFTSGNNSGLSANVKTFLHAGGSIVLQVPMPYTVTAADTYSIAAGCLKRALIDCKPKFANLANFRGFPSVPGTNVVLSGTGQPY